MIVFLNGKFVPEAQAVVSVFDRSFLYGDGLFEVVPFFNKKPFRWAQHLERFAHGAELLKIRPPFSHEALKGFADELVAKNKMPDALLRFTLSRGIGLRGYSPKDADAPTFVMTLHPTPGTPGADSPRFKLVTSSVRLPAGEPLAQFKNANKLPQILARAEADAAGADEALLLNTDGNVVEGTTSNLFWIEREVVCTPTLASGILPGVTRAVVLEICRSLGIETQERNIRSQELKTVDGIFVSLSSWGIVEAQSLDEALLKSSTLTEKIRGAYWELVRAETA